MSVTADVQRVDAPREWPPHAPDGAGFDARALVCLVASLALLWPFVAAFYWPASAGLDVTGHPIGRDFINVWVGPQVAFGNGFATLFDLDAYHTALGTFFGHPLPFHNWGYPLFALPAFWPLAQLPYAAALAIWTLGLFAVFAGVTLSQLPGQRAFGLIMLAFAPACLINAIGGQNGFLSAALFLGGIVWLDRRPVAAGVLFGLLTFKPHLGVVLPFALLALGAWRVIASATVTTIVLVAGSVALFGLEPWRQYVEVTSAYQVLLLERFQGFYTSMMVSGVASARAFGVPYSAAVLAQVMLALPVLAAACWAVRRTSDARARALVLASATPLVTPYAFNYDLTALAAALVWAACRPMPCSMGRDTILFLGWITPILAMHLNVRGLGLAPLALLAVFVLSVREAAVQAVPVARPQPRTEMA
jgi:alpha-1,2-mannosyltransferase